MVTRSPYRAVFGASLLFACTGAPDDAPPTAGMRCVATGVADPNTITTVIDPRGTPNCEVPSALAAATTPNGTALYAPGATVGELHCVGLPPGGEVTLSVVLRVRVQLPPPPRPGCLCEGSEVSIAAQANGVLSLDIPLLRGDSLAEAEPCTIGPEFRRDYRVPVTREGTVHVRLDLRQCDRAWAGPQRCLFVRGTEVRISPR